MSRELQTVNQQNKPALWAGRIQECRNSGHNVKEWCKENGICEHTYYKYIYNLAVIMLYCLEYLRTSYLSFILLGICAFPVMISSFIQVCYEHPHHEPL